MADNDTAQRPIGEGFFHGMPRAPYFVDETNTETRWFPRPVTLTLPDHTQRKFPIGMQEVPVQLLGDPWLLKNGMKELPQGQRLPPLIRTAPVGSLGHASAVMASGVYDATLVPNPRVTDEIIKTAHEFAIMAQKGVEVAQANLEHAVEVARAAFAAHENAVAKQQNRDKFDPEDESHGESGEDTLSPAERQQLVKDREQNEARLGLDQLSTDDRAKFDALSPQDKAKYLGLPPDERAVMLAGQKPDDAKGGKKKD